MDEDNLQEAFVATRRKLVGRRSGPATDKLPPGQRVYREISTALQLVDRKPGTTGYSALRSLPVDPLSSEQVAASDIAGPLDEMLGPPPEKVPGS